MSRQTITSKAIPNRSVRIALQAIVCLFLTFGFVAAQSQPVEESVSRKGTPMVFGSGSMVGNQLPAPAPSKTPTLTPTVASLPRLPGRAPLSALSTIPGQTQIDADTVALYHFDVPSGSNAIDARGIYTGTLFGNASIASTGLYGGVLQMDGLGSYVRTGNVGSLASGTIEGFVDFSTAVCFNVNDTFTIFSAGDEYGSGHHMSLWLGDDNGYLRFKLFINNKLYVADTETNPCRYYSGVTNVTNFANFGLPVLWPYETWRFHHVAGTWGPRGIEIWVDGVLRGVGVYAPDPNNIITPYGAACSPQDEERSSHQPVCDFPQMGLVPGSYGGGLPSYSTFLIGCPSNSNDPYYTCFRGRIDEVRISNVQRIFQVAVVPTVTPTPTQTPVPINSGYSVDQQTTALYHLESISYTPGTEWAIDATGAHIGVLKGNVTLVSPGRFGNSYHLDGNGSFFYPTGEIGNPSSGAVEAWVNLGNVTGPYGIINARVNQDTGDELLLGVPFGSSTLKFGLNGAWADSGVTPFDLLGCWHHVAGTWGARGVEVWVDGVLSGSTGFNGPMPSPAYQSNQYPYTIGCDNEGRCMNGKIDEVRISSVQRTYSPNAPAFAPVRRSSAPNSPLLNSGTQLSNQLHYAPGTLTFLPFVAVPPPCTYGS